LEDQTMTDAFGCRTGSTTRAAGTTTSAPIQANQQVGEIARDHPVTRPDALAGLPEARLSVLDVREDIRAGREPLARITGAVRALGPEQVLVLRAPFEPIPLYHVLAKRGFAHWAESGAPDDWTVWFYRGPDQPVGESQPSAACEGSPASAGGPAADAVEVIDVRGLEPPQPMLRILQALDRLGPDAPLVVRHDRRPILLYPLLEDRGFAHETDEPEPGLVRIVIRRAGAAR
jgi:hypothetical protein